MTQKETKKITIKKNKWNKNAIMNEISKFLPSYFEFDRYEKDERAIGKLYKKDYHFCLVSEAWKNEEYNVWVCYFGYEDSKNLRITDRVQIVEYCNQEKIYESVERLKNSIAEIITGNVKD